MAAVSVIDFEGLAGNNENVEVPDGYAGLAWAFAHVGGKNVAASLGRGYEAVRHGQDVAFTTEGLAGLAIEDPGTFSLKGGHFAAGATNNVEVTFQSFLDGALVGSKTVTLDQEDTVIGFGKRFKHIDVVTITASADIAFDNLEVTVQPAAPGPPDAAHLLIEASDIQGAPGVHPAPHWADFV